MYLLFPRGDEKIGNTVMYFGCTLVIPVSHKNCTLRANALMFPRKMELDGKMEILKQFLICLSASQLTGYPKF